MRLRLRSLNQGRGHGWRKKRAELSLSHRYQVVRKRHELKRRCGRSSVASPFIFRAPTTPMILAALLTVGSIWTLSVLNIKASVLSTPSTRAVDSAVLGRSMG